MSDPSTSAPPADPVGAVSRRPSATDFIMLMGIPRSGTTWLGKIFDSHPDTLYRHEPDAVHKHDWIARHDRGEIGPEDHEALAEFIDRMLETRAARCVLKAPYFRKSYYSSLQWAMRVPMLHASRFASRALGDFEVPESISRRRADRVRRVWKSVSCSPLLATLAREFPHSRSVAIVRHAGGYVASILRGAKGAKFEHNALDEKAAQRVLASDAARDVGLEAAALEAMGPDEQLAWRWLAANHDLMGSVESLPNVKLLCYEELCADPPKVARELLEFAGLDWNPQTEGFVSASTQSEDESFYSVFKDPQKSANKWRDELGPESVARVEAVIAGTVPGRLFER